MAQSNPSRLRHIIESTGLSLRAMTVMSDLTDPYRLDTPSMHRDGAWLREQFDRFNIKRPTHIRGLHYKLDALKVIKPDGTRYSNETDDDYVWLGDYAAKGGKGFARATIGSARQGVARPIQEICTSWPRRYGGRT
jgi:hypothetical protein